MPHFAVDLHNHTPASADHRQRDCVTPGDIVVCALRSGLDVYAATDHLSWRYATDLISAAESHAQATGQRLLIVPGTELRLTYRDDEAHVVALFEPKGHERRLEALLGILGLVTSHLSDETLPLLTFEYDPVEVCRIIDALGGIACVAHADRWFGSYRLIDTALFDRLAEEPTVSAIDLLEPEAHRSRLDGSRATLISCSDSHACEHIGARRSVLEMHDLSFSSLRDGLTQAAGATQADPDYLTLKGS
ncbi:MAG: hypothetical protein Q8M66_04765 [Actinomycetota bacterium]|nr:hypothetical protein [Actinomycetota bacterium]MDZ4180791.1 hypothetical protein [Coriobacteriia bacterium]